MDLNEAQDIAYSKIIKGLNEEIIRKISEDNDEPSWMLDSRLKSFGIFKGMKMPSFGPDLSNLDLDEINYYARASDISDSNSWDNVPEKIKDTFDKLGIPEAEKEMLAGVGAQYDSKVVYHSLKKELEDLGIIFEDMSLALKNHPELVKRYFMKAVPSNDHKFAALHGACWSGGTFLFIPKGIRLEEPLQAYFRMNVRAGGQFEHTIIVLEEGSLAHYIEGCSAPKYSEFSMHAGCVELYVGKDAKLRYSSVENWSSNTYNLNTKRAIIQENGHMEWVGGNLGAGVTMLYPCSVLLGNNSSSSHISIAMSSEGQMIDAGAKVIHIGENTSSEILSKTISAKGGKSIYRGYLEIKESAINSYSHIECDGLIIDDGSDNDSIPLIKVGNSSSTVAHEASAGKINEEELFYLESRGISEKEAKTMIVNGFLSPVVRELPMEYAAEMNVIIGMELEV
ncbi:MAG: Fe-S cluster assembly protein SufB [Candidatus Gracilibacteria bacterium]|nr:Fe-S cluster assembly protein SufB [Candidatus Gracilibacteria bacterium]